jgi:hypothetical protein
MSKQLEKALKLAKRTGDRLIVFDGPESEEAFVVMNLEQYEDLIVGCDCGEDCDCDCGEDCDCDFDDTADFSDFEEPKPDMKEVDSLEDEELAEEDFDIDLESLPIVDEKIDHELSYAQEVQRLTEEELLDKINRDIALWKDSQKDVENNEVLTENQSNKVSSESSEDEVEAVKNKSKWAIRSEVKENADEIIEEDRHYLEEVRY